MAMRIVRVDQVLWAVGVWLVMTGLASASIVGSSGATRIISPPSDIRNGAMESNTEVFAFSELQNVTLATDVVVNVSVPGSTPASPSDDNFSPATIPAGSLVSSYFLHCDRVGSSTGNPLNFLGSITFDTDVLGLIILDDGLNATHSYPGLPGTQYALDGALEINRTAAFDAVTLSADRRTVTFDFRDANAPDDVRIITAAVPEPSSALLIGMGVWLLAAGRWVRSRFRH